MDRSSRSRIGLAVVSRYQPEGVGTHLRGRPGGGWSRWPLDSPGATDFAEARRIPPLRRSTSPAPCELDTRRHAGTVRYRLSSHRKRFEPRAQNDHGACGAKAVPAASR